MRARLQELRPTVAARALAGRRARTAALWTQTIPAFERAAQGPSADPSASGNPIVAAARDAALKATRPVVENERVIHRTMLASLERVVGDLVGELADLQSRHGHAVAAALADQRRLEARLRALETRLSVLPGDIEP